MATIESIDLFLLQVPDFDPARDPVKDTLLIRVRSGGLEGWGECEAAPFVSLVAFVTPESHSTSRPVRASVLGKRLDDPGDIATITAQVALDSMNVLQAPHIYSGVEMALWDLLGRKLDEPVFRLLGYPRAYAKTAYVVVPFADSPEETFMRMQAIRADGFHAVKTGWQGFGSGNLAADRNQLAAAREGLGKDARLFLDVARIWGENIQIAQGHACLFNDFDVEWIEEPFDPGAIGAYRDLCHHLGRHRVAAGENINSVQQGKQLIDEAGIGIIQVDVGRIGGIGNAKALATHAAENDVLYLNHTYTSHLALSAALQPYAGLKGHDLCEFPMDTTSLSWAICRDHLSVDQNCQLLPPGTPGLGISLNHEEISRFLVDLEINVNGSTLYRTLQI